MVNPDPKFQDKKRYTKVIHDGSWFIAEPKEAEAFIVDSTIDEQEHGYTVEDVWMTPHEFERLPDFTGF